MPLVGTLPSQLVDALEAGLAGTTITVGDVTFTLKLAYDDSNPLVGPLGCSHGGFVVTIPSDVTGVAAAPRQSQGRKQRLMNIPWRVEYALESTQPSEMRDAKYLIAQDMVDLVEKILEPTASGEKQFEIRTGTLRYSVPSRSQQRTSFYVGHVSGVSIGFHSRA